MKLLKLSSFLLAAFIWAGCGSNETPQEKAVPETPQEETNKAPVSSNLSEANTARMVTVLKAYYKLKDALVATSASEAKSASEELQTGLKDLKMGIADVPTDNALGGALTDSLLKHNEAILNANDEKCEKQRSHFEQVSIQMLALSRSAGLKNAGIYVQYCPMAFNDKGASWLSDVTTIRNPYFGKKMLSCGEVTDSLQ